MNEKERKERKQEKLKALTKEVEEIQVRDLHKQVYPEVMMEIDQYFKRGKSRKFKIWKKLGDYRKNRENLIGRIMTELCTVY